MGSLFGLAIIVVIVVLVARAIRRSTTNSSSQGTSTPSYNTKEIEFLESNPSKQALTIKKALTDLGHTVSEPSMWKNLGYLVGSLSIKGKDGSSGEIRFSKYIPNADTGGRVGIDNVQSAANMRHGVPYAPFFLYVRFGGVSIKTKEAHGLDCVPEWFIDSINALTIIWEAELSDVQPDELADVLQPQIMDIPSFVDKLATVTGRPHKELLGELIAIGQTPQS